MPFPTNFFQVWLYLLSFSLKTYVNFKIKSEKRTFPFQPKVFLTIEAKRIHSLEISDERFINLQIFNLKLFYISKKTDAN